jgi:hypothetical protein
MIDYAEYHEPYYGDYEHTDSGLFESEPDMVNHPSHYQSETCIEAIDVMKAFTDGLVGMEAVDTAQVIKYICRWKRKNGLEDLYKAKWYLENLIDYVEESTKKEND